MDKNAAYPAAVDDLKADEQLPETTELRQVNYLNNQVEQDRRNICSSGFSPDGVRSTKVSFAATQRLESISETGYRKKLTLT